MPVGWKHFYLVKLGKQDGAVLLEFRSAHFGRESGVDWITKSPKSWNSDSELQSLNLSLDLCSH